MCSSRKEKDLVLHQYLPDLAYLAGQDHGMPGTTLYRHSFLRPCQISCYLSHTKSTNCSHPNPIVPYRVDESVPKARSVFTLEIISSFTNSIYSPVASRVAILSYMTNLRYYFKRFMLIVFSFFLFLCSRAARTDRCAIRHVHHTLTDTMTILRVFHSLELIR